MGVIPSTTGTRLSTVEGRDLRASVRVATTDNITLSGTQTIDGVSLSPGDRVLVKDQSTAAQNGVYAVASGAWSRATDTDDDSEMTASTMLPVDEGTLGAGRMFRLATTSATVGTTSLSFTESGSKLGSLEVTNRIQVGTTGGTAGSQQLHVVDASATSPVYAGTCTMILEDTTRPGLQIVGSAGNIGLIQFGDNSSSNPGELYYDHGSDQFNFRMAGTVWGKLTNGRLQLGTPGGTPGSQQLHVTDAAATSPTYAGTCTMILEDDTRPGIQIVGSANNIGLIQFGDNASSNPGEIYYDHSADTFNFRTGGTVRSTLDGSGNLAVTGGTITNTAANDAPASLLLKADNSDDAGDDWTVVANTNQTFTVGNDIASAGTSVPMLTITPHATVTSSTVAVAGALTTGGAITASAGITVGDGKTVNLNSAPGTDHTVTGVSATMLAGEDLTIGELVYMKSDGKVWLSDANAAASGRTIGMATASISADATGVILLDGIARDDTWNWSAPGIPLYTSGTAGELTATAPSGSGDQVQVVGVALSDDSVLFRPDLTMIQVA